MRVFILLLVLTHIGVVLCDCPEKEILIEELGITVTLPISGAPSFQGTNELCVDGVYSVAIFECQSSNTWAANPIILTTQCSITANVTLMSILKELILNGTALSTLRSLPFAKFVITDVANIINLCEEIVQIVGSSPSSYSSDDIKAIKLGLFQTYSLLMSETKFLLLRYSSLFAINKLLTSIEYTAETMITATSNQLEFYDTNDFSVSIFPVVSGISQSDQTVGITYSNSTTNLTSCKSLGCSSFRTNETSIRISLNPMIVDIISKLSKNFNATPHINFVTYKSTEYFQFNLNASFTLFGTPTAASISNYDELSSFVGKIDFVYLGIYDNPKSSTWRRTCMMAYLVMNKSRNIWSTDGCRNLTTSLFSCNHLTHFAILMDVEQFYTQQILPNNVSSQTTYSTANIEEVVLSIVSYIAISLSLIGLLITMLTFLCFKKLRAHYSQKCIFNLSLALFLMYFFFILNSSLTELNLISTSSDVACVVVAVLLHYSILASFLWMLIMAFIQYIMFIKVFPYYISNFALKAATIAWGVPLIPVIISTSLNYSPSVIIQMPNQFVYGKIGNICWIQGLPFYLSVLLPIALIVLLNASVFIAVVVNLIWSAKTADELHECQYEAKRESAAVEKPKRTRSGRTTSSKATNDSTRKATCNRLIAAIFSCFVILGLTWLFGFLAINHVRVAFSYLFCIFNASQGFMVLIAYVLMSKPKREMWVSKFKAIKKNLSNFSSSRKTSSSEFDTPGHSAGKRNTKAVNRPGGVFMVDNADDSHGSESNILPALHKNSFTSTPKPRLFAYQNNRLMPKGGSRHTSSSNSGSSTEYYHKASSFDEMIKTDLDIRGMLERRKSSDNVFLKSQKGVLATNKHLMDQQKSVVSIHTRPELLDSFSAGKNATRTALGFAAIVPTPIISPKNRKNAQNKRESNDQGHRSRLSSGSTNLGYDDNRTITPSGVSVKAESTVPGFIFEENNAKI